MLNHVLPHNHGENIRFLFEVIPGSEAMNGVSNLFKEVSDVTRLRIFWLLCHCEECVLNLSTLMEMSAPAISHHLAKLRSAGLIVSRRDGKEVFYRSADTKEARLLHRMIEDMIEIACPEIPLQNKD